MKSILVISALLVSLSAYGQSVKIDGTVTIEQTSTTRPAPIRVSIPEAAGARAVTTTPVERRILTFIWEGRSFTVFYDVPKGDPVISYQKSTWVTDPTLAAKIAAEEAKRADKIK